MAKELPYFRFTAQEWQNGDISLESYELKGLFVDICAYYWVKDCSIARVMLEKRFSTEKDMLNQLFDLGIIKHSDETDFIEISFLDEQFDALSEQRRRRQKAGSKGGKQKSSNAKAKVEQSSSYKDKDKDKDKIDNNKEYGSDSNESLQPDNKNEVNWSDISMQAYKICTMIPDLFPESIVLNLSKKQKFKWGKVIDDLNRIDGYKFDEIEDVIKFGREDYFWSKNFLSIESLRKKKDGVSKFEKIKNAMKSNSNYMKNKIESMELSDPNFKGDGYVEF